MGINIGGGDEFWLSSITMLFMFAVNVYFLIDHIKKLGIKQDSGIKRELGLVEGPMRTNRKEVQYDQVNAARPKDGPPPARIPRSQQRG